MTRRIAAPSGAVLFGIACVAGFVACSDAANADDRPLVRPGGATAAATTPVRRLVDLGGAAYRVVPLAAPGGLSGVVTLDSSATAVPAASASLPRTNDSSSALCEPANVARRSMATRGLAGAVVWIAGVSAGKALPQEKRTQLTREDCYFDPRVQAVTVGTTVNVLNDDDNLHRLVFTRDGAPDTLTVMPFFSSGQMVPSERLSKVPGLIVAADALHPGTRGYVAVFAHPYFAVTDDAGRFAIDSVPPGSYTLMVWRESGGSPTARRVTVSAGVVSKMNLTVR